MILKDTLRQGATWYRELYLFSDSAKTTALDLTGKTPRASLMDLDGTMVKALKTAVLGDAMVGRIALVLSRADAALVTRGDYIVDVDIDSSTDLGVGDGAETVSDPAARIYVAAIPGQVYTP